MLKGDLATTPLAEVLASLAETEATGCLHIDPGDGRDEALVYFKAGLVYSAHVPGRRPQLGARLVSGGALAPEALEEALEAQQTELHGWRLGELLVHLGYVDNELIESFVVEQLRQAAFDLSYWREGTWKFRKNEKTREDVGGRSSVAALLAEADRRRAEWERIRPVVQGPDVVPLLSSAGSTAAEMTLDQDQWALLCKVDGERTMAQLARDCGFTTFEAAQVVYGLITAGLLEVEELPEDDDEDLPPDEEDVEPRSTSAALTSVIAMLGGTRAPAQAGGDAAPADTPGDVAADTGLPDTADDGPAAASVAEPEAETVAETADPAVSAAPETGTGDAGWADLLRDDAAGGESELGRLFSFSSGAELTEPDTADPAAGEGAAAPAAADAGPPGDPDDPLSKVSEALDALLAGGLQPVDPPAVVSLAAINEPEAPVVDPEELDRLDRIRAAAAAELAEAHALAEQERQDQEAQSHGEIESLVAALRDQPTRPEAPPPDTTAPVVPDYDFFASPGPLTGFGDSPEDGPGGLDEPAVAAEADAASAWAAAAEAERLEAERLEAARLEAEQVEAARAAAAAAAAAAEADRIAAAESARASAEAADRAADDASRSAAEALAAELAALDAGPAAPGTPERGDMAALLSDVSASSSPAPDGAEEPEAEPQPEPEAAPPNRAERLRDNDTASLLRELSSLGFDDDPPPPAPPVRPAAGPSRPPPAPPREQPKKRKGLFGR